VKFRIGSAESAIHFRGQFVMSGRKINRPHETRFQRLVLCESNSWGDAPGYDDTAPLAPNRNGSERRVNNLIISDAGAIKLFTFVYG